MEKKQPLRKYYNILTTEGADEATILLYGYIGEAYDYWTGESIGVSDIEFVQELNRLAAKYNTIHVRINSPGGEIFHGSAIVTAIRNCPAEVNTWIDGVAASMAGIIWMAGAKRHMAKNGMLMIHSASGICWGNAADMREMAETLDAFDQSLITAAADATGMSEADMKKKYFDGKDHWLTWNEVNAEGWLAADEEYKTGAPMPEDIARLSYRDLVAWFEQQEKNTPPQQPQSQPGFLQKVRAWLDDAATLFAGNQPSPASADKIDINAMNLEELKKSLSDGTLTAADVQAHLDTLKAPATPDAAQPDAENAEIVALKAQIEELKNTVAAWGKAPGEGKTTPAMPDGDLPTADGAQTLKARIKAMNELYASAAAANETAQFVIAE